MAVFSFRFGCLVAVAVCGYGLSCHRGLSCPRWLLVDAHALPEPIKPCKSRKIVANETADAHSPRFAEIWIVSLTPTRIGCPGNVGSIDTALQRCGDRAMIDLSVYGVQVR